MDYGAIKAHTEDNGCSTKSVYYAFTFDLAVFDF